tara:strand:- start:684 stop:983 length:300 start_codon:yes stop_codon:yes gene_type:complete
MNLFWTSKKSINGLKHFVLINKYKEKGLYLLELVSVLDEDINLIISKKEFEKSKQWEIGFIDDKKENIFINEYIEFKRISSNDKFDKILLRETSPFNIS